MKPMRVAALIGLCGAPGCLQSTLEYCTDDYCPAVDPTTSTTTTGAPPVETSTGVTPTTTGASTTTGTPTTGSPADAPPVVTGFTANGSRSPAEVGEPSFVQLVATASDDAGIAEVRFYDGETLLGSAAAGPEFTFAWLVDSGMNGQHALRAVAVDDQSQESAPATVPLSVFMVGGKVLWRKVLPESMTEVTRATGVAVDPAGDVLVGGSRGPESIVEQADQAWVRKYDPDGGVIWESSYPELGRHSTAALATDASGAAFFIGTRGFVQKDKNLIWITSWNGDGKFQWDHLFQEVTPAFGSAIAVGPDGRIYAGGNQYPNKLWLRALNNDGDTLWTAPPLDLDSSAVAALAVDATGRVRLSGDATEWMGEPSSLLVQLRKPTAEVQWSVLHGGVSGARGLAVDALGRAAVVGVAGDDAWLGVFDVGGELLAEVTDAEASFAGVASDPLGRWIVVGSSSDLSRVLVRRYSPELGPMWEESAYKGEQALKATGRAVATDTMGYVYVVGSEAGVMRDRAWVAKLRP